LDSRRRFLETKASIILKSVQVFSCPDEAFQC
jgi:hypothetical protein